MTELHPRDVAEYLRRLAQDLPDFYMAGLCERVAEIVAIEGERERWLKLTKGER